MAMAVHRRISMVSAKLLAEVDMKLRNLVSKLESLKCDQKGFPRAFGGINIIFVGDFFSGAGEFADYSFVFSCFFFYRKLMVGVDSCSARCG